MARDQRTRLNAELAQQYGEGRKRGATPGRNALTDELGAKQDEPAAGELEEEAELEAGEVEQVPERQSKSLFDLPRKEPSRQPLPSSGAPAAPAAASSAKPAGPPAPSKPSGPRRG